MLPELTLPPISRHTLALYCGASGDHNPVHVDIDFAREFGLKDVIAHGMLSMAYLGRLLTGNMEQSRIRKFTARFTSVVEIGDVVTCTGSVVEITESENEERLARLSLSARKSDETEVITGEAVVTVSR